MNFEPAHRVQILPPYVFARIDKIKQEMLKQGRKLTNLGIGDPDLPTPQFILDKMSEALRNPLNHRYPAYAGMADFRNACAQWLDRRFGVSVRGDGEVLALIGSKEGIAHLPLAFVNPGEGVLVPDPGYPVYEPATLMAGGVPIKFALRAENGFLPRLAEIEKQIQRGPKIRLWFLNYPNNPTAASATVEFFEEAARFAKKHDIILCHDNAYSEIYYDGKAQPSFLQAPTAKEVGVEFHSFSKTFNMAGWRVGFVAGNAKVIEHLLRVKTNIDSGVFNVCQVAAIEALKHYDTAAQELRDTYQKRRDLLLPAIRKAGLECPTPDATFYLWARIPSGQTSEKWVMDLIERKGIVTTPGSGFGVQGEGFVRFALCNDVAVLKEVAEVLTGSV